MNNRPYFIGLTLPGELSEHIFSLKWRLHGEIDQALKPLVPHITLLHPSSLQGIPKSEILPEIRKTAAPFLPLSLSLEAVGSFDRRVLYIRVHAPELEVLQPELVQLLPLKKQRQYHQRGYTPHCTLAQVRAPLALDIEALKQRTAEQISLPQKISVDSISLFTQIRPREYDTRTI